MFGTFSPQDYQTMVNETKYNAATTLTPLSAFSGFGSALVKGVASVPIDAARFGIKALASSMDLPFSQPFSASAPVQDIENAVDGAYKWAQVDPRDTGVAGRVAGVVAQGATLVGGASALSLGVLPTLFANATVTGANQGFDSLDSGMDLKTSTEGALVTAGENAAGFAPLAGGAADGVIGVIKSIGTGALTTTGVGIAGREAMNAVLSSNGYPEMAEQYKPLDDSQIAADAITGALFGASTHLERANISTRVIRAMQDIQRRNQNARGAVGVPADLSTANLDVTKLTEGMEHLITGSNPNMTMEDAVQLMTRSIPDPEKVQTAQEFQQAMDQYLGPVAQLRNETWPDADMSPKSQDFGDPTPHLDNPTSQALQRLSAIEPDLQVPMADGNQIPLSQLGQKLNEEHGAVSDSQKLYEAATTCFAATGYDVAENI